MKLQYFSYMYSLAWLVSGVIAWIDNATHQDTLCHREWPSSGGVWKDEAPYWSLPNCANQYYTKRMIGDCMRGKTLYVIGNSVPRQAAFDLIVLLGGMMVDREHQKEECPKHAGDWPSSCHSEYAGVKFKYLYLQWMDGYDYSDRSGFPFYFNRVWDNETKSFSVQTGRLPDASPSRGITKDEVPLTDGYIPSLYFFEDNCSNQRIRSCLARFFADSTENDILVFTMGMAYPLPEKSQIDALKADVLKTGNSSLDMLSFLVSSAVNFKSHLSALFKGQVIRVSLAPANPRGKAKQQTPYWLRTEKVLSNLWRTSSDDKPWYTIDQWAINSNRFDYYNDLVHFNGVLTYAMLYQIFNLVCPGKGAKQHYLHNIIRVWQSDDSIKLRSAENATLLYWIEYDHCLKPIQNEVDGSIPSYLSNFTIIDVSMREFQIDFLSCNLPKIPLLNKMAVKFVTDLQVYFVSEGRKHRIMSASQFFALGFQDFSEVIELPKIFVETIPTGNDVVI